MKNDPESIREIEVHSIVQIVPEDGHGLGGQLMVVSAVESWGVHGRLFGGATFAHDVRGPVMTSRTWNLIEPTGGRVVFDGTGARLVEPKPREAHHP